LIDRRLDQPCLFAEIHRVELASAAADDDAVGAVLDRAIDERTESIEIDGVTIRERSDEDAVNSLPWHFVHSGLQVDRSSPSAAS
jgi:hypothetical protein